MEPGAKADALEARRRIDVAKFILLIYCRTRKLVQWQIFTVIAALEVWDECGGGEDPHYMRGRTAGKYPSFKNFSDNVHPVLNLYDPFGLFKKMSQEKKDKRLVMEVNNGRLAMIGIFGFMAADAVPGAVPALNNIAQPYDGDIMAPFAANFHIFS